MTIDLGDYINGIPMGAMAPGSSGGGGGGGTPYVLPPATTTTLGGIIVGDNLTIDATGKLNAQAGGSTSEDYVEYQALTNAEYNLLPDKSESTLYRITDAAKVYLGETSLSEGSTATVIDGGNATSVNLVPVYNTIENKSDFAELYESNIETIDDLQTTFKAQSSLSDVVTSSIVEQEGV